MQFDLSRLTVGDITQFNTGAKENDLEAMAAIMNKAASENGSTPPEDVLDLEFADFQRAIKAFTEADKAFAGNIETATGVEVDLKKVTARRMNAFYAAVRINDLVASCDVLRECMNSWPEGELLYGEYTGLLKAFMEAVKKTAST